MVQVISAMAHHGYLELDGGELLVRFIVQHCALPDTYQVLLLIIFFNEPETSTSYIYTQSPPQVLDWPGQFIWFCSLLGFQMKR